MRKITAAQAGAFMTLLVIAVAAAVATTATVLGRVLQGDFRGVVLVLAGVVLLYLYAIGIYRLYLRFFPLRPGPIPQGSGQEFIYHVHLLFFLILFYPLTRGGFVPVPLMRPLLMALGTKMGPNTYSGGVIFDPIFVELGGNTLVGNGAMIVPHVIEGDRLEHYPIRIGSNVTIGAGAIVLAGVEIADEAIVSTGAVVTKGTRIQSGEIWGGVPAKLIGRRKAESTLR